MLRPEASLSLAFLIVYDTWAGVKSGWSQRMKIDELMNKARDAAQNAYVPYSRFHVGAALMLENGAVITGANVENRSYGLSNCAERTAIFTAIAQGHRVFTALAIAGPDSKGYLSPCGACRQVISEFCSKDMPVYFDNGEGGFISSTVAQLIPMDSLQDLKDRK